jgi:alpha-L-fucosidase
MKFVFALFILFTVGNNSFTQEHQEYFPDPDTAIQHRLDEWKDLKFGLLMHWGSYSQCRKLEHLPRRSWLGFCGSKKRNC